MSVCESQTRTELFDDRQRIEGPEEHLTIERELASIAIGRREDFQFGGRDKEENLTQCPAALHTDVIESDMTKRRSERACYRIWGRCTRNQTEQ